MSAKKNPWIILIMAVCSLCLSTGLCADEWFQKGLGAMSAEDYDAAVHAFSMALENGQNPVAAHNNRAVARLHRGEYQEAMTDCDKALQLDPYCAQTYNNRGSVWLYLGRYDRAIEDYTRVLELSPGFFEAYYNRGIARQYKGDLSMARDDYRQALALAPDFREAKEQLAKTEVVNPVHAAPESIQAMPSSPPDPKQAFAVQVGSFLSEENARNLCSSLKEKGYDASVRPFLGWSGQMHHAVRIGIYEDRETARQAASDFSKKENLPSTVRPSNHL